MFTDWMTTNTWASRMAEGSLTLDVTPQSSARIRTHTANPQVERLGPNERVRSRFFLLAFPQSTAIIPDKDGSLETQ